MSTIDADRGVLAGVLERPRELDDCAGTKGVTHVGAVDGDLRDPGVLTLRVLVDDVAETGHIGALDGAPKGAHAGKASLCAVIVPYWLERAAGRRPDDVALVTGEGTWTYGRLLEEARGAAGELKARGVERGERVAIELPAGLEFARTLHGCMLYGVVAAPLDLRLAPTERRARREGCAQTVAEPLGAGRPWQADSDGHDLDAIAVVMHTSGTSATPKEVPLTFGNLLWSALGSAVALGLDERERWLCALPLSHVGGLSILVRAAIYGTGAVVHERFDADRVLNAIEDESVTILSVVATTLTRLLDAGMHGGGALRCVLTGGGPVPPALRGRAADAAVPVALTYGLTEAASQVTTTPAALSGRPPRPAGRRSSARACGWPKTARSSSAARR